MNNNWFWYWAPPWNIKIRCLLFPEEIVTSVSWNTWTNIQILHTTRGNYQIEGHRLFVINEHRAVLAKLSKGE